MGEPGGAGFPQAARPVRRSFLLSVKRKYPSSQNEREPISPKTSVKKKGGDAARKGDPQGPLTEVQLAARDALSSLAEAAADKPDLCLSAGASGPSIGADIRLSAQPQTSIKRASSGSRPGTVPDKADTVSTCSSTSYQV